MLNRFYGSLDEIVEHLQKVRQAISGEAIKKLVSMIVEHPRVFCYGAGRSGFIARCFAQRLMHIGVESYFVGDTVTPSMKPDDVFIVVSGSGRTTSSLSLAQKAKELGVKVVAITAHTDSPLAKIASLTVFVPGKTKLAERKSYAPLTSLFDISVLGVLDSIISELMEKLKVTEEKILERHANVE